MIHLSSLTHHATLITHPERKELSEVIWKELSKDSISHVLYEHTVIDIDTARKLIVWANTPYHEDKIALLSFHSMTLQAQNALLKVFEEPRKGVRFILVTTGKNSIIPTLLSRLEHRELDLGTASTQEMPTKEGGEDFAKKFLKTNPAERMKLKEVTSLLLRKDEEDRKDREKVQESIYAIATELKKSFMSPHYIEKTLVMASYSGDPSSSGKSILEYLSLLLPIIKERA